MSLKAKLNKLFKISLVHTVGLNMNYFGWSGVLHPRFIVSRNVIIKSKGKVIIDDKRHVWLGFGEIGFVDKKEEHLIWDNTGVITFKGNAYFCPGCKIVCMNSGHIVFGNEFSCNAYTKIICNNEIRFGDSCMISWDCTFLDTDFHKIIENEKQINMDKPIVVGDHVWVCAEVMVLKGAKIPDETVIAVRSLISSELRYKNSLYCNDKQIKDHISWEK